MSARTAECPVCFGTVTLPENVEESEIITCPDCGSRLVVASLAGDVVKLEQAPEVEEDWGE